MSLSYLKSSIGFLLYLKENSSSLQLLPTSVSYVLPLSSHGSPLQLHCPFSVLNISSSVCSSLLSQWNTDHYRLASAHVSLSSSHLPRKEYSFSPGHTLVHNLFDLNYVTACMYLCTHFLPPACKLQKNRFLVLSLQCCSPSTWYNIWNIKEVNTHYMKEPMVDLFLSKERCFRGLIDTVLPYTSPNSISCSFRLCACALCES